ncbi:MAG: helix-turn-helix transcriptional regulator [Phenylobacterium sp.]|uniref:helix-turn-helix domain-containing protein n=1 Tax=Phenylobacterium sp. TaxID=1871053 RepID=UPI0027209567|nr:helix-turn-helix transcriptional regulator [Phenylobacterium sp.]MDO8900749.1 helix-turn-helix transcriptional regulator [Phenylobacterium sp.]
MPGNLYTEAYSAFVGLLRDARVAAGLTQEELANRLGRPQSFVSKSERRERRIDVVEFIEIARALGLDPARLLADVERSGQPGDPSLKPNSVHERLRQRRP